MEVYDVLDMSHATVLTSLSAYVQSGMSMIAWAEAGELYVIHHGLMTQGDFETTASATFLAAG